LADCVAGTDRTCVLASAAYVCPHTVEGATSGAASAGATESKDARRTNRSPVMVRVLVLVCIGAKGIRVR